MKVDNEYGTHSTFHRMAKFISGPTTLEDVLHRHHHIFCWNSEVMRVNQQSRTF